MNGDPERCGVPSPWFARPAGRVSSSPAPRGQPDPPATGPPRWVFCPVDGQLHLMAPVVVTTAAREGHGSALCGRLISADGLTLNGRSGPLCISCLAVGTAP